MTSTYRSFLSEVSANALRGHYGERLVGAIALLFDGLADGASEAVKSAWVQFDDIPYDAPAELGRETSLPRYPAETRTQHIGRIREAWDTWVHAGVEETMIAQLAAAGFLGAQIFHTSDPINWSRFFLFFPVGTHDVTDVGATWGSFTWGDGTTYGPGGITGEQIQTLRAIVRKWKPGIWVCGGIIFQLSGWAYGDGSQWGGPGLVWGGESAVIGAT